MDVRRVSRGFTLIELLVVVAIIGILAIIAVPSYRRYQRNTYNAAAASELRTTIIAQEAHMVDSGSYVSCISPFDCELNLPTYRATQKNRTYQINPIRHDAALDGQSFQAFAGHISGTQTYRFDSAIGTMTHD